MRKKRLKFMILTDSDDSNRSFPIKWNRLPEELTEKLDENYFHNILSVNSKGGIEEITVVYVKNISRFRKNIRLFENTEENIIFGYDLF